ncbi:hypothetical protein CsSME_00012029 [Camellia sinensis var. sinensis]
MMMMSIIRQRVRTIVITSHWVPFIARYYIHYFIFVCEHIIYYLNIFFIYLKHHIFFKIYFNCVKYLFYYSIMLFHEQEMPPGLRLQPYSRPLTPTPEEGMDPPRQEIGTQPLPPHNVQLVHEVTASSSVASHDRRGRGPTRGIQTQRIVQKNGKMLVPVPEHFRAPVGATLSVTLNQWTSLIDKKWNSKEFMEQSLTNVNNRMQMKTKHRCGSKSIPVRVHSSIIANGEVPDLAKFYKSIHYNSNTHEWISSESQANYDNMIKTQAEHLSRTGVIPLSQEELSVKVLKPRSGYVKGLGLRPSSSMKTTVVPAENSDYVQRLEMQIAQQNEQIARFQKSEKKQSKKIQSIIECLTQKGITGNFENGESSDSDEQAS